MLTVPCSQDPTFNYTKPSKNSKETVVEFLTRRFPYHSAEEWEVFPYASPPPLFRPPAHTPVCPFALHDSARWGLERQPDPVVFAKLGSGVEVTEYPRAEEFILEALCSHPQQGEGGDESVPPCGIVGRVG